MSKYGRNVEKEREPMNKLTDEEKARLEDQLVLARKRRNNALEEVKAHEALIVEIEMKLNPPIVFQEVLWETKWPKQPPYAQ